MIKIEVVPQPIVQIGISKPPQVFTGAGSIGLVPDPITESGRVLSDSGDWVEIGGEIVTNVLKFKAQEANVGTPTVDNTFMFERKYIQNGYKIIELVSKDETDEITVLRTTKILL